MSTWIEDYCDALAREFRGRRYTFALVERLSARLARAFAALAAAFDALLRPAR